MPQRRKPQSLRSISIKKIIQNLGIYSTKELQTLPNNLSEELIDLYNKELLRSKCRDETEFYARFTYRNRLIKRNMKKLNLCIPDNRKLFFRSTLMIVLKTCKSLTHFSCDFNEDPYFPFSIVDLHHIVISLVNIIELKLNFYYPVYYDEGYEYFDDDDILETIGNTCFQLEILHLTNSGITDDGVRRFCLSKSTGAKIKDLDLDGSRVTFNGCLTALRNLKQLRRFQCFAQRSNQLFEAFRKLFDDSKESPIPTFQLCEFFEFFHTDDFPTGFLSFVMKCCANVPELYLIAENNFDRHIKDLKSCNENVFLYLRVGNVDNFMANLGFVGCRIAELDLNGCDVHLPTIGFTCPNVTDLTLLGVNYMPVNYVARNDSVVPYNKLLRLCLMSKNSLPIPIEQLQFLLRHCVDLQLLRIEFNDEFTDDIMSRILHGVNPLRHLKHFELESCNAVTVAPIFGLLAMENDLETLLIGNCQNFPKVAILQIISFIKENNFCVTLKIRNLIGGSF